MRHYRTQTFIGVTLLTVILIGTGAATAQDSPPVPPPAPLPLPVTPSPQVIPVGGSPGLVEVEQILGYDGLDRLYLKYQRNPGLHPNFGSYMLNYSTLKVNRARRLSRLGNVLMIVGGATTVLGVAWMINASRSDEPQHHQDDDYYYDYYDFELNGFERFLAAMVILVGGEVLAGGVICKILGVRKIRRYSDWQRRLGGAMMDPYARRQSRWQGIGLQLGKERMTVGTGVTF
ncbi:MAG: hypothetical protein JXX14_01195 [Deltaproteobacteria bacterium]|nr:hypothetical protein [Deltaproteobacteria bacterium]